MSLAVKYHRYIAIAIALLSLVTSFYYNEVNLKALLHDKPADHKVAPIYHWLQTPDDPAYLRPAENYYYHHVWKDNNPGRQSYFLRTPGYGLFRYALMRMMGFEKSYFYFRYIQLLVFAFSVLLLYEIALLMGLSMSMSLAIEALYGLSPFAVGFLYHSITEGITPALIIAFVFFLLLGYRRSWPFFFIVASLVMAYIGITRPVLLLFAFALPFAIWWSLMGLQTWRRFVFILLNGLIAFTPITIWAYRSYQIANGYIGIYPIYYVENNSQFRPTHEAIWRFEKSFGTEGRDFHSVMVPLWRATVKGDTSETHIDSIMMGYPAFVKEDIGEQRLRASYQLYRQSIIYQRTNYPKGTVMPDTIPAIEQEVIREFDGYTTQINRDHLLWCHVMVPLKVFKEASFHSNLSLYVCQHTWRGLWWMESLRAFFLILHLLCCLSFIYMLLVAKDKIIRLLFGFVIGAYFFYLCYFFRGLEERYTLPILPLMMIGLFYSLRDMMIRLSIVKSTNLP